LVERVLGKDEVIGSIPINGSRFLKYFVYVLRSIRQGGTTSARLPIRCGVSMSTHEEKAFLKSWAGIAERQRLIAAAEMSRLVERP
jgi:hypothetical protein